MQRVQQHQFVDLAKKRSPAKTEPTAVDRRGFLAIAAGLAAATGMSQTAFARNFGPDAPPQRYPDPDIVVLDKRFKYKLGNTPIQRLHTGTLWAEGPAWNGVGRYLLWSDIPNDEILRWLEEDGHVGRRFRFPSGNTNGNTFDYQGRQISCEHGTRNVVRYEYNGKVTVLADKFDGKEFNAPNDARRASQRRLDLVHRPGLRQPDELRRQPPGSASNVSRSEGGDLSHRRAERRHRPR